MVKTIDVVAIGNAIVDVLAKSDDEFLRGEGIEKGAMTLIDEDRAADLYSKMSETVEASGGSAGNTVAGLAALGSSCGYIGKVRDDVLGTVFRKHMVDQGVKFETAPATEGPETARCLILVTPDAQRSMNTYLGACVNLGPEDVDEDQIAAAKVVYLEGYLWDPPEAKKAFVKAARIAHESGGKVALSLSDPFCVDRHRKEFIELVNHHVDILFANEAEICSLYQTKSFNDALQKVRFEVETAALTRSEKGSVIVQQDEVHVLDAEPVSEVVDSTGAGDLFAAGFLHGYTQAYRPDVCGIYGGVAAAEVISHFGARPETDLQQLLAMRLS